MIAKRYRLTSKDINYILRKGKKIHTPWFSIFVIPQYSSNNYHQVSPQISTKIHKRSTVRNPIRRAIIDGIYTQLSSIHLPFGKFLVMPNKQQEQKRIERLASMEKKNIYTSILQRIQQDIFILSQQR
jgi:ribonuclease P protein component